MLRMRAIALCAHDLYSANHDDTLSHNITVVAGPSPVDVGYAAHACDNNLYSANRDDAATLIFRPRDKLNRVSPTEN